jgi:L-asparaginase
MFITLMTSGQELKFDKPQVVILTTGGTIASRTDAPMVEGHALIQAVPEVLKYADVIVEQFSMIGSSKMTPDHWLRLSKRINTLFRKNPALTGIIITHGTDSMEETGFFLNLTVRDKRPVILTGSMRASNEISADGPANLLNAVRVAVSAQSIGKGVLLVMNEDISAARDVIKTNNRRVHTFQSHEYGFLGSVDPDTISFGRIPQKEHTYRSEFDVFSIDTLPSVDIVSDFTGFDPAILDFYISRQPDGLIVQTFAGGRRSDGATEGISKALQTGIPVVIASRVPGGRIIGNPPSDFPVIFSHDLPAHKARILLMLALTKSNNKQNIENCFARY